MALTAPALELEEDFEPTAAELAAFLADEDVMLEMSSLPDILGSTPAWASPEIVADVRVAPQHVAADSVQEAVQRAPDVLGSTRARQAGSGSERQTKSHLSDHSQVGMTAGQQALYMARQRMQISRTDSEMHQVVHALALALGAQWTETATLKALFAVLVLLNRPELSEQEVCASTGASLTTFKKWWRLVLNAQAGLPPQAYDTDNTLPQAQEAVKSTPTSPEAKLSGPPWLTKLFNEVDGNNHARSKTATRRRSPESLEQPTRPPRRVPEPPPVPRREVM